MPKKLYVRDRTFDIAPVAIQKGNWPAATDDANATWVFGTLVNYLIGLPNTSENKDLLQALSEADQITLEMSDGQMVDFKFDAQQLVSPNNAEIFTQHHPGLTFDLAGRRWRAAPGGDGQLRCEQRSKPRRARQCSPHQHAH